MYSPQFNKCCLPGKQQKTLDNIPEGIKCKYHLYIEFSLLRNKTTSKSTVNEFRIKKKGIASDLQRAIVHMELSYKILNGN